MSVTSNIDVVEFPEEGFAVLEDSRGKFIALRDRDEIIDLNMGPDEHTWPKIWVSNVISLYNHKTHPDSRSY